ncbi:MAG: bifunctional (p)ppGpp synthetase/guanosine-3',5'-bis(diphosphate) 3'-pyrophosphohydrolase [Rickettsiales bacterium]
MIRQAELVEKIKSYDPNIDEDLINRAYVFSMKAHGTQKRASGDLYFSHPVEVAYKLTKYKLDAASIVTALLHDTVEDTEVTLEAVEKNFGKEVRELVDGVTKLSRLEGKSENIKQAENFRKLLIAMSKDLRVLLVKLADRLHNMETLSYIKNPDKRKRISRETLEIYAALAERIGIRSIKEELQDLAFAELYPEARDSIIKRMEFLREEGVSEVEKTKETLREEIAKAGLVNCRVRGREKRPFSIWKKMENKKISFEQLSDIVAFRISVGSIAECYQALGAIHAKWHTIPGRFKDYISTPKSNGYQSIHTTILGPAQQRVEIQIRTFDMDEVAEYGLAAHWAYKQGKKVGKDGKNLRWVRELLEILEQSDNPEEFLENTKLEMYQDQVFCFTPKGDILSFPRGATPVDFAYAVHSGVGDTCVGAKINSRIVPLRTKLKNGDQVDIITSKTQTPSASWERFVVTGKARSEIRKYLRTAQRNEYIALGKAIMAKSLRQEGEELTEKLIEPHLPQFNRKTVDDLMADIGEGMISRQQVVDVVIGERKPVHTNGVTSVLSNLYKPFKKKNKTREAIPIRGVISGMAIHFAGCCHPIPGDKIVGIVTTGKGITIHTMDCETLENYSDAPERWIDVAWEKDQEDAIHIGRVKMNVSNEQASLATVTNVIARENGNISNFKITNRSSDFFELMIDIEVRDIRHLNTIIANLRGKEVVQSVERAVG